MSYNPSKYTTTLQGFFYAEKKNVDGAWTFETKKNYNYEISPHSSEHHHIHVKVSHQGIKINYFFFFIEVHYTYLQD